MMDQNAEKFKAFQPIHDGYAQDPGKYADEFHAEGRKILDIVRDWERRLCHGMEKGQYASYSAKLAEKFWDEIKKDLPKIEEVGVKISHK